MFDFYEKRKVRNIMFSKPVLVLLGIVVLLFVYSVWGAYQKESETREKWKNREEVLIELEGREKELSTEIDRLETEKGTEAEIRSKFEVAKEGEEVIVIVEPPEEEVRDAPPPKKGFFKRIFGF